MSKELEKLENLATLKCITDHEHIDRVLKYMLSLPFSYLQKDEVRYKYLRDDLSKGFNIYQDDMNKISMEDVLILIGYEPGNPYFNPPDGEKRGFNRKFNAAGDNYVLAISINNLSKKDIRIKEFTHIGLSAYTDYLRKKVEDEYKNNLIPFSSCSDILHKVDDFKRKSCEYLMDGPQVGPVNTNAMTLGDLISKALTRAGRTWMCAVKPLEVYCTEIIESYDILNRLFMDSIRMPLIRSDRERFQEIITQYSDRPFDDPVSIDYENCYEHGGIIQQ